jgi:hypothetical protein
VTIETARTEDRGGSSAPAIFGAILALLLVSIGAPALLLGLGRTPASETATPPPAAPLATSAPGATTAPAATERVRVVSASGSSTATGEGTYRVTFTWTLQGANENDTATILVYAGNQLLGGEQEGTLDPSVFSFSTGRFAITAVLPCSASGWSAELIRVRGLPTDGESEATVPGVTCT